MSADSHVASAHAHPFADEAVRAPVLQRSQNIKKPRAFPRLREMINCPVTLLSPVFLISRIFGLGSFGGFWSFFNSFGLCVLLVLAREVSLSGSFALFGSFRFLGLFRLSTLVSRLTKPRFSVRGLLPSSVFPSAGGGFRRGVSPA